MMSKGKEETVTTTLRLSKEKHLKLRKYWLENEMTMTDFFNNCIDRTFVNEKSKTKKEGK